MLQLLLDNPIRFFIALLIGVAVAWWIWGRVSASQSASDRQNPNSNGARPKSERATPVVAGAAVAAAASGDDGGDGNAATPNIAAAIGESDDLTRIKGVGPKLNDLCLSLGVRRFDQIAGWSGADIAEVDQYLKIKGRITRDRWVDQAKLLAVADDAGHKAEFG